MTIQQLNYAITISEAGSISKAAERLFISQPSLTGTLQELEREVGFPIFNRGGRGVTLTSKGLIFVSHARSIVEQFEEFQDYLSDFSNWKRNFAVSTQHYSFAVKAFAELVNEMGTANYEFAIRETQTNDVITDVTDSRSEIGILYLSDVNRPAITKMIKSSGLEFQRLAVCKPYVYLWAGHPLARHEIIRFEELQDFPFLCFEQGEFAPFYLAEEILAADESARIIRVNDRGTMLNLMAGVGGYTLCAGLICGEYNGPGYRAIPLDEASLGDKGSLEMEIGYIKRENTVLSETGAIYIRKIREYLHTFWKG